MGARPNEDIPGNRIKSGGIRWRPQFRVRQSETLLGLEWDETE
jgi:hypothetical protein